MQIINQFYREMDRIFREMGDASERFSILLLFPGIAFVAGAIIILLNHGDTAVAFALLVTAFPCIVAGGLALFVWIKYRTAEKV